MLLIVSDNSRPPAAPNRVIGEATKPKPANRPAGEDGCSTGLASATRRARARPGGIPAWLQPPRPSEQRSVCGCSRRELREMAKPFDCGAGKHRLRRPNVRSVTQEKKS